MNNSIWKEFKEKPNFANLQNDIDCDILVVGGGMAGLLTAHFLGEVGKNVIVVEAKEVGSGITANTTAVISAQHDTAYADLIKMHGIKKARCYLDANLSALERFRTLCSSIDCDFTITPSYMYSLDTDLAYEQKALRQLGFGAQLVTQSQLPFQIKSAIKFPDMAQFHPLKFLFALAKGLNIYENTFITKIKNNTAFTDKYKINFKQAVIATHFPFINKAGWFFVKMYQKRSYVMALEKAGDVDGTFIEDKPGGFYFRNYDKLLLVGKGDHRTGTNTKAFEELETFAHRYYPDATVKNLWVNQDCVTLDNMPYVGKYGRLKNIYTLSGFNLWGMTGSMMGAKILADVICGRNNEFAQVFKTKRRIFRLQLFKNLGVVLLNWVKPTIRRCPHLGCALKYNKREHSWDCSCHGSRFNSDGELIDNPAMREAKSVKGVEHKN